ncbi:hypothetical protein ABEB36_001459 [Hypothenemus hampei]|uniref:C3H1-type domain-containing protein n=1 Tax=Hypothenemus hampei TaxID=57062 RepID=A0ABD1FI62_HYPHA
MEVIHIQLNRMYLKGQENRKLCRYCHVYFDNEGEFIAHCRSEEHEVTVMSDMGKKWLYRTPPRGFTDKSYEICENWEFNNSCRYGAHCIKAHGEHELAEWQQRYRYREVKLQGAIKKHLFGKSYTEKLVERWVKSHNPNELMCNKIYGVDATCSKPLSVSVVSKNTFFNWTFTLKTCKRLKAVALLQDTHRMHFRISSFYAKDIKVELQNDQEWIAPELLQASYTVIEYKITVDFKTQIFGTFRQSIVFDFGTEPLLVQHLCVDLINESNRDTLQEIRRELANSIAERWTENNCDIVKFQSALVDTNDHDEWNNELCSLYPYPAAGTFVLSQGTINDIGLTANNYRERMHELLYIEEIDQYNLISNYNLTVKLTLSHSYTLSPDSTAASTTKYSNNGELFACFQLSKELSEDSIEGRLILMHSNSLYFALTNSSFKNSGKRRIYEALIVDKGKDNIYLSLSSETVKQLKLTSNSEPEVQIQFQLNRIPFCEWHYVLDKMLNFQFLFPINIQTQWTNQRGWSEFMDGHLNTRQLQAISMITMPLDQQLPPILVIGPYGTGKTFTLAQAVKNLVTQDSSNRILLCTHSNSAADLYIKDYLDKFVLEGDENVKPLRLYYQKRWVTTVSPVVRKYCLIEERNGSSSFRLPIQEDLEDCNIVVVTLSTSVYLSALELPHDFFTHIFIDEAAQALECETITPLLMANEKTRIVLAGDYMQMTPEVFSPFAKKRNMHVSLLERLYSMYTSSNSSCSILLYENYRAHDKIIQFTSESFYNQENVFTKSKQIPHPKYYPLTFFTTRGEDVQDKNATAFYNISEVYEVVERVAELKENWPAEWGDFNEHSVGVFTPYADQVFRIRSLLRQRYIDNVCVERVNNVQGKQFRVVVLSTVRTRKTCLTSDSKKQMDYGFLSNIKLLNTAITRAQSLVAVVGDPVALCSIGKCSKIWERFIELCDENNSLYGIHKMQLKFQLDSLELRKPYILNPLAPEFIPRSMRAAMQQPVRRSVFPQVAVAASQNCLTGTDIPLETTRAYDGRRLSANIDHSLTIDWSKLTASVAFSARNESRFQFRKNVHFP